MRRSLLIYSLVLFFWILLLQILTYFFVNHRNIRPDQQYYIVRILFENQILQYWPQGEQENIKLAPANDLGL